ncbi:Serine protease inhibitor (serpin family) [Minicystis rosea]|nr:Serine protease inhibitor (serpin family) [Minicystis rosea]
MSPAWPRAEASSMNLRRALPLAGFLSLSAAGCQSSPTACIDSSTPGCVARSDKQRIQTPNVTDAALADAVKDNTAFAMDLYQQIRREPGNLFFSPYSISSALAMTFAGARGATASHMASALHFTLPQDQLHPAFNALDLALASRGENAEGKDGGAFRLNVANALWGQTGYDFLSPFLDTLAQHYGAGMHVVNFSEAPDKSREIINAWVENETEDRIKNLLPQGSVDPTTRLVLTNAVYFNAAWAEPFKSADTVLADFKKRDGTTVQVQTMSSGREARYGAGSDWAAVELPYDGQELSMILVLPAEGAIDTFEASLSGAKLAEITNKLTRHFVTLTLPRFKIESTLSLSDQLSTLGMADAFTTKADFSGIDGKHDLFIGAVVHKAFIDVNEAGTEAAAATGVVLSVTSVPEPAEIHFNRPYLFFIRDKSGTVLFFGRVESPQG